MGTRFTEMEGDKRKKEKKKRWTFAMPTRKDWAKRKRVWGMIFWKMCRETIDKIGGKRFVAGKGGEIACL